MSKIRHSKCKMEQSWQRCVSTAAVAAAAAEMDSFLIESNSPVSPEEKERKKKLSNQKKEALT